MFPKKKKENEETRDIEKKSAAQRKRRQEEALNKVFRKKNFLRKEGVANVFGKDIEETKEM